MKLSAVVVASNEQQMIGPCLDLLGFADEIVVVVDQQSSDKTEEIARKYTKKVYRRKLESFASQKNFAIRKAAGDWILVVDADERVTPALAREISTVLESPADTVGYRVAFKNYFLGRQMRFGGWQRDKHVRLIRKAQAIYQGDIHERFNPKGPLAELREPLWHFSHRNIQSMMLKTINYGEVQSSEMYREGHPPVTTKSFLKVLTKELNTRLIQQRGYKDRKEGVIESIYQAFSLFIVYVMLWQKQRTPSLDVTYRDLEKKAKSHK